MVPAAYFWQMPVPSHLPLVPQVAGPMSMHRARGSAAPMADTVHLPMLPARLQLRQAPVQAVLQQTPSTHCWLWQSPFTAHFWPSSLGPQLPLTQATPSAQSALPVHFELHAPLAQR